MNGRQLRLISKGLEGTEKVITIGLQRAREGMVVAPTEVKAPPPEPRESAPPEPDDKGTGDPE